MLKVSEMEARGSKTLVAAEPMRRPSWLVWTLMKTFRTVLLTVLWSGLGMGAGLFCGIVGLLVAATIQHQRPEMDLAYRHVAIPVAICAGSCALLWNLMLAAREAAARKKTAR
jgi:ABC-type sugar transport system permease subunit